MTIYKSLFSLFVVLFMSFILAGCLIGGGNGVSNQTTQPPSPTPSNSSAAPATQPGDQPGNQSGNQPDNTTSSSDINASTQVSPPPSPPSSIRYLADKFSFEYPANMAVPEHSNNLFIGKHTLNGTTTTGEVLAVEYLDTAKAYGQNKDELFTRNPSKAAADFLAADGSNDPLDMLSRADELGEVSTFSVARDAYVAELKFKLQFEDLPTAYTGYALDIYVPERSLHAKVRIIALDPDVAKKLRDDFLLSFRLD